MKPPPARPHGASEKPADTTALTLWRRGSVRLTAVNQAAAEAGLYPGMTRADARARTPGLHLAAADPAADVRALERLADWCGRYTPWTAVDSAALPRPGDLPEVRDGLLLDVTGCAHLFGGEKGLARDIIRRFSGFGIDCRLGLADTPGAAWAVARFGPTGSLHITPPGRDTTREAIAPLPVAALRLDAGTIDGLTRVGLRRVGDLLSLPRASLARRFGNGPVRRLDQALGHVDEPISPRLPVVPYRVRFCFLEATVRQTDLEGALLGLLGNLCDLLVTDRCGVRRLELRLYRVDGVVITRRVGTSRPVREAARLARLFEGRFEDVDAGFGIEAVDLAATLTESLEPDEQALGPAVAAGEGGGGRDLGPLVDRLGNRLGFDCVLRAEPCASHLPEQAVAWRSVTDQKKAGRSGSSGWPAWLSRPLRLLPNPERIEALAEVPDGPPRLFQWRRETIRVFRADGPERIAPEWWRGPSGEKSGNAASLGAATRDYYRVEDERGRRFWLFREGLYPAASMTDGATVQPRWFLHGLFA